MKPAAWLLLASIFLFVPTIARAALDGNELLQKCEPIEKLYSDPESLSSKQASGVVYCLGYIGSFIETFYFQRMAKIVPALPYCLPGDGLSQKEIVNVVVEYLKSHPEELAKPAGYHIFMALREEYPCNKEKNKVEGENNEAEVNENKVITDQ